MSSPLQKNKVGPCLIKVRPCCSEKPPCFFKVPVCLACVAVAYSRKRWRSGWRRVQNGGIHGMSVAVCRCRAESGPMADALHGFGAVFVCAKGSEPDISFAAGAKAYTGRGDHVGVMK